MKPILFIPAVLMVAACSIIPASQDPVLYNHAVELSVMTSNMSALCGTPQAPDAVAALVTKSAIIDKYTTYTSDTHEVTSIILSEYKELAVAYTRPVPPSVTYCKMKTNTLVKSVDRLLETLGNKPK